MHVCLNFLLIKESLKEMYNIFNIDNNKNYNW